MGGEDDKGGFEIPPEEYALIEECARTGRPIPCAPIRIYAPIDISNVKKEAPMWLTPGEPDEQKGTWKRVTRDGKPTVRISCPICGLAATLEPDRTTGHVVEEDGSVVPSIVCTGKDENGDACRFHEFVELRDWNAE